MACYATFIGIVRDRGHGRVEVDQNGEAVPYYPVQDSLDIEQPAARRRAS